MSGQSIGNKNKNRVDFQNRNPLDFYIIIYKSQRKEKFVQARVGREFGMEGDGQLSALARGNDMVINRGQYLDPVAYRLDVGRADEDHRKWLFVGRWDSGD